MSDERFRVLPALDGENDHFWTGGKDGELRILRCRSCLYWIHPAGPICPACHGFDLAPEATSGRAEVHTFTVNHQPWDGTAEPYVIAVVALPEQDGLRLTTNIVGCEPDEVEIGLPVSVVFEDRDPVWIPVFEPVAS